MGTIAEAKLEVFDEKGGTSRIAVIDNSPNADLTEDEWEDASAAHLTFPVSETETALAVDASTGRKLYYATISIKTDADETYLLCWFNLCVQDDYTDGVDGTGIPTPPSTYKFSYNSDGWPRLHNPTTQKWHPLFISGDDPDNPVFSIGPAEDS